MKFLDRKNTKKNVLTFQTAWRRQALTRGKWPFLAQKRAGRFWGQKHLYSALNLGTKFHTSVPRAREELNRGYI